MGGVEAHGSGGRASAAPPGLDQLHTPTFHSRKGNVSDTQIDGAFCSQMAVGCLTIMESSRHEIGTDHDRVEVVVTIKGKTIKRVRAEGPRVVCRGLPQLQQVTQSKLEELAGSCTKPASLGPKFVASAATKTLGEMARFSKQADDWKNYPSTLRKEKMAWKAQRIENASSNWGLYKALTKNKKAWGDDYMARAHVEDPAGDLCKHFHKVFHDDEVKGARQQLDAITSGITNGKTFVPFSRGEVVEAVLKGKNGKAVGPDLVPNEVLKSMVDDDMSVEALRAFYNDIAQGGIIPDSWDVAVATLIPKLTSPGEAKHLRPITLSSHAAKTFARLLLKRMDAHLKPQGPKQFACPGRQPAEMAWLTTHVAHLSREWQSNCYMLNLARAFDSTKRVKLAERIMEWTSGAFPFETRSMIRMLASAEVVLSLPWHDVQLQANSGVKQGATESPALFSRLIDEVLCSIPLQHEGQIAQDMNCDGAAFMDDIITWKSDIVSMQRFVDRLVPLLAAYGLRVQPSKSKLLCLRGDRGVSLVVDGQRIEVLGAEDTFSVLNLPISVENTEKKILEALLDKARSKYYQILHILNPCDVW